MPSISRAAELGVCVAWVATALSCARQSVPANDSTTRPSLGAEWVAYKDGCNLYSYEYYGYHLLARCGESPATGTSEPVETLFEYAGCRGYRFKYGDWHHVVLCGPPVWPGPPKRGRLDQPIETLTSIAGCQVRKFEYYGWHQYLDCGQGGPSPQAGPGLDIEPLFSFNECDAYRYEYYGWHYVVRCDPQRRWAPLPQAKLDKPIQTLGTVGNCTAHRFEYFGWHDFVRCQQQAVSTVISSVSNCRNYGIPMGPVRILPGPPGGCPANEETVVTIGVAPMGGRLPLGY